MQRLKNKKQKQKTLSFKVMICFKKRYLLVTLYSYQNQNPWIFYHTLEKFWQKIYYI